jgi:FAD-linked oxidoreductase
VTATKRGIFRNWSGSVRCAPARTVAPTGLDDLVAVVADSARTGRTVRVVGAGHSFTPLVATDDTLVSLEAYQGIEHIDRDRGEVTVRGGTTLARLNADLLAAGLAMENLGDIDAQSIAGAISTGTHGTGAAFGSIATQVTALRLVTPPGTVVDCSNDDKPDLFAAARVSLGTLGIIASVTLRVLPAYRLWYRHEREPVDALLDDLPGLAAAYRHAELYWFPHTPHALVKRQNATDAPADGSGPLARAKELAVENAALGALCGAARAIPASARAIIRTIPRAITPAEGVDHSHEVFATRRLVRFQEMEYAVPRRHGADALRDIRAWLDRHRYPVVLPIEVRFVAADDLWLSPAHDRDVTYLAVHAYQGMPFREYFLAAEEIFRSYDGRPHWGKMHSLSTGALRASYPRFDDFCGVRAATDPDGVFLNGYLRRLLGVT